MDSKTYLIENPPLRALTVFALPMIVGNLFQQFYTMVDSAIVGRFVGEQALAAVGASYSLTNVFIWFAVGGGIGSSVIVSKYFGAGEYAKMKRAAYTALVSFFAVSVLLALVGIALNYPIMRLLRTPGDVIDLSVVYLNIYFLGLPFLFMYNVFSAMFNALGKSRIPLCFLIFSSVLNVLLDVLFVTRLGLSVAGVAWATLIAQGISAFLSLVVFLRLMRTLDSSRVGVFDRKELVAMTKIAVPSILQQSTVSIGMMLVQSVVNSFGSEVLAGFSAGMRVEAIAVVPMNGIGTALSSFSAQNIGAGKKGRVVNGYRAANILVVLSGIVLCLLVEALAVPIARLFLGDDGTPVAYRTAVDYLRFMGFFFSMIGFKMAVDGLLRGSGDMTMFTVANLVNLSIRVVLAFTLAPRFGVQWVWYAVPMGWTANFLVSYAEYRTGKWRGTL